MILQELERICRAEPDRIAVVAGPQRLSYGELEDKLSALAARLREAGAGDGSLVAIYGRRTTNVIVALLAVMACSAAYTVVEEDDNRTENYNRLKAIRPDLVLCDAEHSDILRSLGMRVMDNVSAVPASSCGGLPPPGTSHVAYVLFTSGSTGKPKGVAVTHGNIAHYTSSIRAFLGIDRPLSYAHVSTLAADLGNTSLFLSLTTGGCLHLVDAALRRDPTGLRTYLIENGIEFLKMTPSHWSAIFAEESHASGAGMRLHYLLLGGEVLSKTLARRILESRQTDLLVNHYGPTETTVGVTACKLSDTRQIDAIEGDSIPIGLPFGDTTLLVRKEDGTYHARGAQGELHIGGPSVAAGYRGDEAATAKSFVTIAHPFVPAQRYYRTGDQVSIGDDGMVRFLGRTDRQVKVNGYRVELEHIESVLRARHGITNAAVFFIESGGRGRLVAAVCGLCGPETIDAEQLKTQLREVLPEHMIPRVCLRFETFPRNHNGKADMRLLREQVLSRLETSVLDIPNDASSSGHPREEVRAAWREILKGTAFRDDDNFFDLGADSLDAIELIAGLQGRGHRVTANAFLNDPTVRGLVEQITSVDSPGTGASAVPERTTTRALSCAQDFFLRRDLAERDHYNQAILLECGCDVDAEALRRSLIRLLATHSMLRAAYTRDAAGWQASLAPGDPESVLTVSHLPAEATGDLIAGHIEDISQDVQRSLCIARGRLFRAHLFKMHRGPDHLLLVAHHLAVDVISWRILVSELSKLYGDASRGEPLAIQPGPSMWDWVDRLDRHADTLVRRARSWLEALESRGKRRGASDDGNTESAARTLWMAFSPADTRLLAQDLATELNAPLHLILLATLARNIGSIERLSALTIDVESHGRLSFDEFDDVLDPSRQVGWHTSTFPVVVDVSNPDLRATISLLSREMNDIPDLGVAHGLMERATRARHRSEPSADVCYNFIGDIGFGHDGGLFLQPSHRSTGRARGGANVRSHQLNFTARIIEGQVVMDLSFGPQSDPMVMKELMRGIKADMLGMLGRATEPAILVEEAGTRTGLITYLPRELAPRERITGRRSYAALLLTGGTGYVGCHVLERLLHLSDAHVYCIVRAADDAQAGQRLRDAFAAYFPDQPLTAFASRVTALAGDMTVEKFGLKRQAYDDLRLRVNALYHFAADTRLFGAEDEFRKHNILPVHRCIEFAGDGRPKDLHYMSTLAVAGVNPGSAPVDFDEGSMNIGQEFQNHYEATKYCAEQLVRQFHLREGRGFIYRSGNVSGHSRTARFQRNARDNRLVQFLAGCAKLRALPRELEEPLVLSPVDEVANGIVAISLNSATHGGVFHVESPHGLCLKRLFDAFQDIGIEWRKSGHRSFSELFGDASCRDDADIRLARFWANRQARNVRYSHTKTHALLRTLGCSFSQLDDAWISRFIQGLDQQGVFALSSRQEVLG